MAEEEQSDVQNQIPQKKGSSIGILIGAFILVILLLFGFAIGASAFSLIKMADYAPNFTSQKDGGINCSSWESASEGYQEAITSAANQFSRVGDKVPIQPALLGAIFLSEHGNSWPQKAITDTDWAQGGNGVGPFQIEEFENKWKTVSQLGLTQKVYPKPAGATDDSTKYADPQNFADAALAAGGVLYETAHFNGVDIPLNTADQNEIQCLAAGYNGGPAMCASWKGRNYDTNDQPNTTNQYHVRAWNSFQSLNQGCSLNSGGTSTSNIVAIAQAEIGYDASPNGGNTNCAKYNPASAGCVNWCANFVSWVYTKAGNPLSQSSVDGMRNFFKQAPHQYKENPAIADLSPGDVIFLREYSHVGIVEKISTDTGQIIFTIEGNTGGDDVSRQTNHVARDFSGVGKW